MPNREQTDPADDDSDQVRCVLHSIGYLLLVHPDIVQVDRRTINGTISESEHSLNQYSIQYHGKIRIRRFLQSDGTMLPDLKHSSVNIEGFNLEESILLESHHSNQKLSTLVGHDHLSSTSPEAVSSGVDPAAIPSAEPIEMNLDFSRDDFFVTFRNNLAEISKNEIPWDRTEYTPQDEEYATFLLSYFILIVDDLDRFLSRWNLYFKRQDKSGPVGGRGEELVHFRLSSPIPGVDFPYCRLCHPPTSLIVTESKEVFEWLDTGSVPDTTGAIGYAILGRDYLLQQNRFHLIDQLMRWMQSAYTNIRESLPTDMPDSIEARRDQIEQLVEIGEEAITLQETIMLSIDYIQREWPVNRVSGILTFMLPTKESLEKQSESIERSISMLDRAVQRRLDLNNLLVVQRTSEIANRLTWFFATFVTFEILGTFVSWFFIPPGWKISNITYITWIVLILVPISLAIYAWRKLRNIKNM
ncbi:MAG: hypothetical protein ACOC38_11240 [Promethearchaeia archaeon]